MFFIEIVVLLVMQRWRRRLEKKEWHQKWVNEWWVWSLNRNRVEGEETRRKTHGVNEWLMGRMRETFFDRWFVWESRGERLWFGLDWIRFYDTLLFVLFPCPSFFMSSHVSIQSVCLSLLWCFCKDFPKFDPVRDLCRTHSLRKTQGISFISHDFIARQALGQGIEKTSKGESKLESLQSVNNKQ